MNRKLLVISVILFCTLLVVGYFLLVNLTRELPAAVFANWSDNNRAGESWLLVSMLENDAEARGTARQYFIESEKFVQAEFGFFQPNPWLPYMDGRVNLIDQRFPTQEEVIQYLKNPELVNDGASSRIRPDRAWVDRIGPVFDAIGVKPGKIVCDMGFGKGYYTFYFSHLVGPKGQVYAVDVDSRLCRYLEDRIEYAGISNIKVIESVFEDAKIPADTLDALFMFDVFHCMTQTLETELSEGNFNVRVKPWLKSIYKAMKPGGMIAIVDLKRTNPTHSAEVNPETVIKHMKACGFEFVKQGTLQEAGDSGSIFFYQIYEKPRQVEKLINLWEKESIASK